MTHIRVFQTDSHQLCKVARAGPHAQAPGIGHLRVGIAYANHEGLQDIALSKGGAGGFAKNLAHGVVAVRCNRHVVEALGRIATVLAQYMMAAGEDEALDALALRRLQQIESGVIVRLHRGLEVDIGAVGAGQVQNGVDPLHGPVDLLCVGEVGAQESLVCGQIVDRLAIQQTQGVVLA
ncbi:hypothetical protein D3C84_909430 [compost metagenome]